MPTLMEILFTVQKTWARLLIFQVLTATRQEAAREIRWKDVNFEKKLWIVSKDSDKMHSQDPKKRTVVLSDKALSFLKSLPRGKDEDFIFPSSYRITGETVPFGQNKLWDNYANFCKERVAEGDKRFQTQDGRSFSPHATARATFKTWSRSEMDDNFKRFDAQSVEHCLLHFTDAYKGAYDRSELLSHRKFIMDEWAKFLLQKVNF